MTDNSQFVALHEAAHAVAAVLLGQRFSNVRLVSPEDVQLVDLGEEIVGSQLGGLTIPTPTTAKQAEILSGLEAPEAYLGRMITIMLFPQAYAIAQNMELVDAGGLDDEEQAKPLLASLGFDVENPGLHEHTYYTSLVESARHSTIVKLVEAVAEDLLLRSELSEAEVLAVVNGIGRPSGLLPVPLPPHFSSQK